ncbi:MAG: hypothetical protein ACJ72N_27580 [Labedaea sp.]
MSADSWARCPRCLAKGELGLRGREFREDWELGLNDPEAWGEDEESEAPTVIFNYSGECQSCGLSIKIRERFPLQDWTQPWSGPKTLEPNQPDVPQAELRPWSQIPAGWFIQDPKGLWWEIVETEAAPPMQKVTIRQGGHQGTWERPPAQQVMAAPGTLASPIQGATDALFSSFTDTRVLKDQVD